MKYFGTDGIRGKAYSYLNQDLAYKVGEALSLLNNRKLVIAMDTRESSRTLADSLIHGALSVGIDVIDLDVLPTPALILESYFRKSLGVMITASHNPYTDNGIKIVKNGLKIDDKDKMMIEDSLDGIITFSHPINGNLVKEESTYSDFLEKYILRTNLNIVVDCANGASYKYVNVLDKMAKVKYLSINPDGININEGCGATHLDYLKNNMDGYDLGIAFDGDADRIMVIDDKKSIVDGDILIYLFAKWFKKLDLLKKDTVVLTIMSNLGIINALKDININTVLTKVGDQNVLDEMIKNGYSLGGENSGHIITPFSITGDGLLNAIILLTIISENGIKLSELIKDIKMYPAKTVNLKVSDKTIINNDIIKGEVERIENSFGSKGKVILRPSGTEDLIRITVMHIDSKIMEETLDKLLYLIKGE